MAGAEGPGAGVSPRVVKAQGVNLLETYVANEPRVAETLHAGLLRLTRAGDVRAAWLSLVKTNDIVGVKVFSAPGQLYGTRPAVVEAVVRDLLAAGLPGGNVVIWDKRRDELAAAGFDELGRRLGVGVESAQEAGYDAEVFYLPDSPVIGRLVWGDFEFGLTNRDTGKRSFVSKLVSRRLTKIISVAPLINEDTAGLCGHFFSLGLGSVDNTHRFEGDPQRLAVALPELLAQPAVGDRTVLYITDALMGQYQGGPAGYLQYSVVLNQIWLSRDPVAIDVAGLVELSQERHKWMLRGWQNNLEIYTNAALLQLGQNVPERIPVELVP